MPMAGKGPQPNIMMGSSMMLATQPAMRLTMVTFILPTAWNTFSKPTPSETMTPKPKTTVE